MHYMSWFKRIFSGSDPPARSAFGTLRGEIQEREQIASIAADNPIISPDDDALNRAEISTL